MYITMCLYTFITINSWVNSIFTFTSITPSSFYNDQTILVYHYNDNFWCELHFDDITSSHIISRSHILLVSSDYSRLFQEFMGYIISLQIDNNNNSS